MHKKKPSANESAGFDLDETSTVATSLESWRRQLWQGAPRALARLMVRLLGISAFALAPLASNATLTKEQDDLQRRISAVRQFLQATPPPSRAQQDFDVDDPDATVAQWANWPNWNNWLNWNNWNNWPNWANWGNWYNG